MISGTLQRITPAYVNFFRKKAWNFPPVAASYRMKAGGTYRKKIMEEMTMKKLIAILMILVLACTALSAAAAENEKEEWTDFHHPARQHAIQRIRDSGSTRLMTAWYPMCR